MAEPTAADHAADDGPDDGSPDDGPPDGHHDAEAAWAAHPGYEIVARPFEGTGRAVHDGLVLAESERCLIVAESDHRDVVYFPRDEVRWEHFAASDHRTTCPFKGVASYWSLVVGDDPRSAGLTDVVWTYERPFDRVADLAGHVAFYADRVDVTLTERFGDGPDDLVTTAAPAWGSADDLVGLMDVRHLSPGRFVAPPFPDPPFGSHFDWAADLTERDVVEGGQLLGAAIVAAARTIPDKRVTTASALFLSAASFSAPVEIDVEVLRDGRQIGAVDVRLRQGERLRSAGQVLLDRGGADVLRLAVPLPDVAGPEDCPPLDMGVLGRDLREVAGGYRRDRHRAGPAEVHVWARFRRAPAEQVLHQALLAQATTHWTIAAAMRPDPAMTEDAAHDTLSTGPLAVSIAFHDDVDVTQWMLYSNPAVVAGRGSAHGEGRVHAVDGRLLATYSVQAMIRPFDARPEGLGGARRAM